MYTDGRTLKCLQKRIFSLKFGKTSFVYSTSSLQPFNRQLIQVILLFQLFSVLFFLMLFVLGIGSNIGMAGCVMTVIRDKFPDIKPWKVAVSIGIIGCTIGFVYTTPVSNNLSLYKLYMKSSLTFK